LLKQIVLNSHYRQIESTYEIVKQNVIKETRKKPEYKWCINNQIDIDWYHEKDYMLDALVVGAAAHVTKQQEVLFVATFGKAMDYAFDS